MIRREFEICNKLGLHARAAAKLVQCATRYRSHIEIERRDQRVNCKSIMGVMMLAASQGTWVTVEAVGDDEEDAMVSIETLIRERFGEAE
ncbi:HPr family phosphocarrier protein [Thiocystis violascens]|uniref:Phosphotransferase system HPr (HPr) family protein n=1 Tax=Thiocystis violascens (strain ATCC 17096 / DSM 198 / 6111) TaxID=765911 RepID=I3YB22_THIV6|nr:HPr family phosphocarrier protein [Thiocystis violascens]AFL74190.1 phosphotransferase system HPr (HPr) family protein [Thiocystis violascens DSM 198]